MEKLKKMLVMLLVLCITFSQFTLVQAAGKKAPKYAITMNKSIYTMKKGKTVVLKATLNKAAKKKQVVWSSSNKSVVTVSSKGKVTAKKSGRATVTAKIKGTSAKAVCKVTVGTPVEKIKLAKSSLSIGEGVYYKMNVKFSPKKPTNSKLTYKSSDTSVATITPTGVIKGINEGKAKITVMAADGTGKSSSCNIEVEPKKEKTPNTDKPDTKTPETTVTPNTEKPSTEVPSTEVPSTETPSTEVPDTEEPGSEAEVESVILDEKAITLELGQEKKITSSIMPANAANQKITWQTSKEEVASVDDSGTVKALKEGTAVVTAVTANGKEAACEVTVESSNGIVTTQEELNQALINEGITKIVYETTSSDAIEIPSDDYSTKVLEINAPNGDVINNGTFEKVVIYAIAMDTYVENAENTIEFKAEQGHIVVGSTGIADIRLSDAGNQTLHLENNGCVSGLDVPAQTNLNIDGRNEVPVTLGTQAADTDIKTSVELNITSGAKWDMSVLPGGEQTKATVDSNSCIPSVYGLGRIPVTVNNSNTMVTVAAEMRADLGIDQRVSVSGKVQEYTLNSGNAVKSDSVGADIYLIPFTSSDNFDMDVANAGLTIGSTPNATTDATGNYKITDVVIGNYWMLFQKNNFKFAVKNICITSDYTNVYSNSLTTLLQNELYTSGNAQSISGTIIDGLTGQSVNTSLIQVELRKGNGNILGKVYKKAATNEQGMYEFTNIPTGVYTIHVVDLRQALPVGDTNYNQANVDIVVAPPYLSTNNYNCVLNPQMNSGDGQDQVQFTLTWGTEESGASADIDSHLWGPSADGYSEFHTFYGNKGYYESIDKRADLDVDDTTYEGPEHTTIYKETDGIYRFYVHNYSQAEVMDSDMFGKSSIQVRVTIGDNVYNYDCPDEKGNLWYVCDYDSIEHKLIPKNEVSTYSGGYNTNDIGRRE